MVKYHLYQNFEISNNYILFHLVMLKFLLILNSILFVSGRINEYLYNQEYINPPIEHQYLYGTPTEFSWNNVNGTSYITRT